MNAKNIGERFVYNNEEYIVKEYTEKNEILGSEGQCNACDFDRICTKKTMSEVTGACAWYVRQDEKNVYFYQVGKVR